MSQGRKKPLRLHQLIRKGEKILADHYKVDAAIDSELLALHVLGCTRLERILNADLQVKEEDLALYMYYIKKRCQGIPLQYITKEQEFMGLPFYVDPYVLIPRQDTETLVEVIIEKSKQTPFNRIIEIGVGSGCISISLAKYLKGVTITGIDISKNALKIAEKNARINKVEKDIQWVHGNLLKDYKSDQKVDLIVSNPPYIKTEDYHKLDPDIKKHEPIIALEAGQDGLDFYRRITTQARHYLAKGGMLAYEIGYDQGQAVMDLLNKHGFVDLELIKDLAHKDRVVLGRSKT